MINNLHAPFNYAVVNRRKFIAAALQGAGALAVTGLPVLSMANNSMTAKQLTVQQVINLILKEGNLTPIPNTVDTIKVGDGNQQVTGIVTTMFATIAVIEAAAKLNANFIIAHEPTFYNHLDDKGWVKDNTVVKQKLQLLDKYKIAVWRFHDYCHALQPDAIMYGVAKKAGWLPYFKANESMLTIPAISLEQLAQQLKSSLGIQHVRVIGNLSQQCTRIALLPGAWGGQHQVSTVEKEKPDVLIAGEVVEWETVEYMRDAKLLGGKTGLIVLGHAASEDPGMEWIVDWLQPKLPGITVTHIASGDPFVWL